MASTVANAVVLQVPYCILQNFNFEQPFTLSLRAAGGGIRDWQPRRIPAQVFCYNNERIVFELYVPARGVYTCFDLVKVDPNNGTTATVQNITVPQATGAANRRVQVDVSLNVSTWVPTLTIANS